MGSKNLVTVGDLGTDHEGFPTTPVVSGSPNVLIDGRPVARLGDPLAPHSKPKHPPHPRAIASGEPTILINGKPAAITGGTVNCGGVVIGSGSAVTNSTPGSVSNVFGAASATAIAETEAGSGEQIATSGTVGKTGSTDLSATDEAATSLSQGSIAGASEGQSKAAGQAQQEPGFHVVREPMSKIELLTKLFGAAGNKPASFDRLNPDLGESVLPGEMIVLGDPEGLACTQEEADLMEVAARVNTEVHSLNPSEAQFLTDHYDLLEMLTSDASTGLGAGATMISKQIGGIEASLHELETLHKETYKKYGHLNSEEFFEKRRSIFKKLDFSLGKVARKGLSLDDSPKLKTALGLSTKSLVHSWNEAGVGEIPGYSRYYERLARGARLVRAGGYLGIGLDASLTGMRIYDVCTAGKTDECERVSYVEGGRLAGSVGGGYLGGTLGAGICVAVGFSTAGVGGVVCGVLLGGAGAAAGGTVGGSAGEEVGEMFYKVNSND